MLMETVWYKIIFIIARNICIGQDVKFNNIYNFVIDEYKKLYNKVYVLINSLVPYFDIDIKIRIFQQQFF